jgi:hypothetical protein
MPYWIFQFQKEKKFVSVGFVRFRFFAFCFYFVSHFTGTQELSINMKIIELKWGGIAQVSSLVIF